MNNLFCLSIELKMLLLYLKIPSSINYAAILCVNNS